MAPESADRGDPGERGGPPPMPSLPAGAPERVTFDGILDGRVADEMVLRRAAAELGRSGAGGFVCEIDGGRFTLLPEGTSLPTATFAEDAQSRFLDRLTEFLTGAIKGSVESTLRCSMLYPEQVAETLFRVVGGQIEPLSRVRPRQAADGAAELPAAPVGMRQALGLGRRELAILVVLLVGLGVFSTWRLGLIDRVLAARADAIEFAPGSFGRMLDLQVNREWGAYRVTVRRGVAYPADAAALQAAQAAAPTLTERASCEVVGNGGEVWVQLLAADGRLLDAARIELRPLLGDPDGKVETWLPGRMDAASLGLSLTRDAKRPK